MNSNEKFRYCLRGVSEVRKDHGKGEVNVKTLKTEQKETLENLRSNARAHALRLGADRVDNLNNKNLRQLSCLSKNSQKITITERSNAKAFLAGEGIKVNQTEFILEKLRNGLSKTTLSHPTTQELFKRDYWISHEVMTCEVSTLIDSVIEQSHQKVVSFFEARTQNDINKKKRNYVRKCTSKLAAASAAERFDNLNNHFERVRLQCYYDAILSLPKNTRISSYLMRKSLLSFEGNLIASQFKNELLETWILFEFLTNERAIENWSPTKASLRFLECKHRGIVIDEVNKSGFAPDNGKSVLAYSMTFLERQMTQTNSHTRSPWVSPWALLALMLRCGYMNEARDFAARESQDKGELGVVALALGECAGISSSISKESKEKLLSIYRTSERTENDPFKLLVLNILGGFEVTTSAKYNAALSSSFDKIWFYLNMLEKKVFNVNILPDFITSIQYDSSLVHFQSLVMGQQFNQAYLFLLNQPEYYVDAVHFGLVLSQHEMLSKGSSSFVNSLCSVTRPSASLAVRYAFMFPTEHRAQFITKFVMYTAQQLEVDTLSDFFGTNGVLWSAFGEKTTYGIGCSVARACFKESLLHEALWLYFLVGEYVKSMDIVNIILSRIVFLPESSTQKNNEYDVIHWAEAKLTQKLRPDHPSSYAFFTLLKISNFYIQYSNGSYFKAIYALKNFIPINKADILDEKLISNFQNLPEIVLKTFPTLFRLYFSVLRHLRENGENDDVKQACIIALDCAMTLPLSPNIVVMLADDVNTQAQSLKQTRNTKTRTQEIKKLADVSTLS